MVALTTFSIPVSEVGFRLSGAFLILICALLYRLYMQPSLPIEQVAYWSAMVSMSTHCMELSAAVMRADKSDMKHCC